MFDKDLSKQIADELEREREEAELSEYTPPTISNAQVNGAKYAWMVIAFAIDAATAYALWIILAPYWWYAILWLVVGAGGLVFAEWLWERVGNNDIQFQIADVSKKVAGIAVIAMALVTGIILVGGIGNAAWMEVISVVLIVGMLGFTGMQAYRYHENDDDYIAMNLEAKEEAKNQKELRAIHRAGRRVEAKEQVHVRAAKYRAKQGQAFDAARGQKKPMQQPVRQFASDTEKPIEAPKPPANPQQGQGQK
jgi:signal transduction histidine kinase